MSGFHDNVFTVLEPPMKEDEVWQPAIVLPSNVWIFRCKDNLNNWSKEHWTYINIGKRFRVRKHSFSKHVEGTCHCQELSVHPDDIPTIAIPDSWDDKELPNCYRLLWIAECQISAD